MENDEMISPAQYAGKLDFCLGLEIDSSKLAGVQLIDSSSLRQWMPKSDRFGEKQAARRGPNVLGDTRFIYRGKPNNKPPNIHPIFL